MQRCAAKWLRRQGWALAWRGCGRILFDTVLSRCFAFVACSFYTSVARVMCGLAAIVAQTLGSRTLHAKVLLTRCAFCWRRGGRFAFSFVSLLLWLAHALRDALLTYCHSLARSSDGLQLVRVVVFCFPSRCSLHSCPGECDAPAARRSVTDQVRVVLQAFGFALSLGLLILWPAHDLRVSRRFELVVVVATRCSIASCVIWPPLLPRGMLRARCTPKRCGECVSFVGGVAACNIVIGIVVVVGCA